MAGKDESAPKVMLSVYAAALPVRDRQAAEGLEALVLPGANP